MSSRSSAGAFAAATLLITGCLLAGAASGGQLPIEPLKDSGQNVYPAFEGWYQNPDGTYSLLLGYFNRNLKQELDIPVGPENQLQPGGPDLGQPTHFMPRRGWGVFVVKVPKDFGANKIVWTITANGKTVSIPFGLTKGYQIEPLKDEGIGNTPPTLKFGASAPAAQGPPPPLSAAFAINASAGEPTPITAWATDDGRRQTPMRFSAEPPPPPRLTVTLSQYRGPGTITFAESSPKVDASGKATTTATFSAPGDYVIRVEGNDDSGVGGSGFQCCWTTTYLKVAVKGTSGAIK